MVISYLKPRGKVHLDSPVVPFSVQEAMWPCQPMPLKEEEDIVHQRVKIKVYKDKEEEEEEEILHQRVTIKDYKDQGVKLYFDAHAIIVMIFI
jgi:hypothetical protein